MAKYAELPDGTRLEFPDDAADAVIDRVVKQHLFQSPQSINPTEGMSTGEKLLAGAGKAFVDIGRGAGQILGLVSDADVAEARRLDAPLMETGAGKVGNIGGNIAAAIPSMFIPGAASVTGGAAIGAGLGALQPTTQGESRTVNAAIGGIAGGALPAAIGGYRAIKAGLYDPLAGHSKIIGGAVTRAVGGQDKAKQVAQALRGKGAATPGVRLSSAEISQNEALAAMEDALRTNIPGGQLATQAQSNRAALANTLRGIGQDDTALQAAIQARSAATDPLYEAARTAGISPAAMTEAAQANMAAFQARLPDDVLSRARELAKLSGVSMDNESSIQGLHWVKKALDSKIGTAMRSGDDEMVRAYVGLKNDLVDGLANLSPNYDAARRTFQEMSKPISEMQVGQKLANTLIPPTSGDIPAALNYASLARAMRSPDTIARQATGFEGARMAKIMSPDNLNAIQGVTSDASRIAESLRRGVGIGSPTARRLATSDFISQHFAEQAPVASWLAQKASALPGANILSKGASTVGGFVGNKINKQMAENLDEMLATNPQQVAVLIEQELSRLSAPERNQLIKMIPQSVMLALPSMNSN